MGDKQLEENSPPISVNCKCESVGQAAIGKHLSSSNVKVCGKCNSVGQATS